jgi:hypothetical protein
MNLKKILSIGIIFLVLLAVPAAIYLVRQRQELRMKGAPDSNLSFSPASSSVNLGDSFTLEAVLETGTNTVAAVEVHIIFNAAVFEANNLRAGSAMSTIFDGPLIDNSAGTAFIVVGDVQNPVSDSGVIALIDFTVIGSSGVTEEIGFSAGTQASAWGEEGVNVLTGTNSASITILSLEEPTAAPTISLSPTPTTVPDSGNGGMAGPLTSTPALAPILTPTPTTGGGEIGGPVATSTPTSLPTPTPVAESGSGEGVAPTSIPTTAPSASPTATSVVAPPVTGLTWPTLAVLGLGLGLILLLFSSKIIFR